MSEEKEDVQVPAGMTEMDLARQAAGRILDSEDPKPNSVPEGDTPPVETATEEITETPIEAEWKHKLKLDDEEVEIDLPKIKGWRELEKKYGEETARLLQEVQSSKEKAAAELEPVRRDYAVKLQTMEQLLLKAVAPELQNIDWNKLAQENPAEWAAKMQRAQSVGNLINAARAEMQRVESETQAQTQAKTQKEVTENLQKIKKAIPNWNDDVYAKVIGQAQKEGFSETEAKQLYDARTIIALHKAAQFDELKSKPIQPKAPVPKVVRPGNTAESPAKGESREELNKAMAQLRKSGGRTDDAVRVARLMLG